MHINTTQDVSVPTVTARAERCGLTSDTAMMFLLKKRRGTKI